MGLHN
jgi:hypothetical protein